ncbi:hypothetical protein E2C01_059006 [Portunus trituberculatus]|uniref:Uncharacterized protein n=1 Tax=Portunus trituberculatus TaxID=210409 RepID=A0A5B7H7W9_PORTR|nr:hypothetical protein [Portunus trituberculatus]
MLCLSKWSRSSGCPLLLIRVHVIRVWTGPGTGWCGGLAASHCHSKAATLPLKSLTSVQIFSRTCHYGRGAHSGETVKKRRYFNLFVT